MNKTARSKTVNKIIGNTATYFCLILLSLFILIPFYIIFITSFKTNGEAVNIPFTWWPREGFHLDGYSKVLFNDMAGGGTGGGLSIIMRGFINTIIVVIPPTIMGLLVSALAAFAFAKLRFPCKSLLFPILLFTMMIPGIIVLVPSYLIYDMLGLVDTRFPLMVPGMFGAAACVFFLRQFFKGLPDELVEAARLDGMSFPGIFLKIILPLSVPALLAQGILGFIGGYNDYLAPYLYLQSPELYTLQIALRESTSGAYNHDWQAIMAGSIIALLPMLIIYIFTQKFFIKGIAMSGLKA